MKMDLKEMYERRYESYMRYLQKAREDMNAVLDRLGECDADVSVGVDHLYIRTEDYEQSKRLVEKLSSTANRVIRELCEWKEEPEWRWRIVYGYAVVVVEPAEPDPEYEVEQVEIKGKKWQERRKS